jgi:hypothetical protein
MEELDFYGCVYLEEAPYIYDANIRYLMIKSVLKLAITHNFSYLSSCYFYLFDDFSADKQFQIECDVIEVTPSKIAIESYLYEQTSNSFVAKLFAVVE